MHDGRVAEVWTAEELQAVGLYDPQAPDADERLILLRLAGARGGTFEQVRDADAHRSLLRLAGELMFLAPGERYSIAEVAERAGVDVELTRRIWQVMGLPEITSAARVLTEREVALVQTIELAGELLGETAAMQLLRVVASSMARIAESAVSTFVTTIGAEAITADPHGDALVQANETARMLFDELLRVMETVLRQQFVHTARPNVLGRTPVGYETSVMAVGFVDVVDSTALVQWLPLSSIGTTMARFEGIAADVVNRDHGRVVKFVGDEVMFTAHEPKDACSIALDLVDAFEGDEILSGMRAGVAYGEVLVRDADYFGAVVNLAARATKAASRGVVLVDEGLRAALAGDVAELLFGRRRRMVSKGSRIPSR